MVRGKSSGKTKILKNCKLYGFESIEPCYDYFSKIAAPFMDCNPYIFTVNISEKFKEDFPDINYPSYPIRSLLKYLKITIPTRKKRAA